MIFCSVVRVRPNNGMHEESWLHERGSMTDACLTTSPSTFPAQDSRSAESLCVLGPLVGGVEQEEEEGRSWHCQGPSSPMLPAAGRQEGPRQSKRRRGGGRGRGGYDQSRNDAEQFQDKRHGGHAAQPGPGQPRGHSREAVNGHHQFVTQPQALKELCSKGCAARAGPG